MQEKSSWGFHEGDEIVAGRHATRLLGGGRRYEAYLAWDDELHALVVAKIVRPALVESQAGAARDGRRGAGAPGAEPPHDRSHVRRRRRGRPPAPRPRTSRRAATLDAAPALSRRPRAAPAARARALLRPPLHAWARVPAPRRQAAQRRHVGAPAPHRPQRRDATRRRQLDHAPDRNRRVHGARAVRPRPFRRHRAQERHLGPRGHAVRGADARASVPGLGRVAGRARALPSAHERPVPPSGLPPAAHGRDSLVLRATATGPADRPRALRRLRAVGGGASGTSSGPLPSGPQDTPQRLRVTR